MPRTELIMGALLTVCRTRIQCPECEASADVGPLLQTATPNRGFYTRNCRGCGIKLAISHDSTGDAVCWIPKSNSHEMPQPQSQPA